VPAHAAPDALPAWRQTRWEREPLVWILLAGAVVRVAMLIGISPAILSYPDTWGYIVAASGDLVPPDWIRPHGYPLILRILHGAGVGLRGTIVLQHIVGLATAALVYATVRRGGGRKATAAVPAAFVALSLDIQYLEHSLLGEIWSMLFFYGGLYAAMRALAPERTAHRWAALAGVGLGVAAWIRPASLFVIPALALIITLDRRRPLRTRLLSSGAILLAGVMALGVFVGTRAASGEGLTTTPGDGWALYSRAAPFADCDKFDPPEGTEVLCETTPPEQRPGPDFYGWSDGSPGRQNFVGPPMNDEIVGSFGRAAIAAQPGDFVRAVLTDLARVVGFDGPDRPDFGADWDSLSIDGRDPGAEGLNRSVAEPYYGSYNIHVGGPTGLLGGLQDRLRPPEPLYGLMLVVGVAGVAVVRQRRIEIAVLLVAAVTLIGSQVALTFNPRYVLPALPALVMAASLATEGLLRQLRSRPDDPPADPDEEEAPVVPPEEGAPSTPRMAGAGPR